MNENINKIQNSGEMVLHDERGKFAKGHHKVGGIQKGSTWYKTKFDKALTNVNPETQQEVFDELLQIMLESIRAGNTDLLKFVLGKVIAGEDNKAGINVENLENLTIVVKERE